MTSLGGQSILLACLIVLKLIMYLLGADKENNDEPSNNSYFRLHESFKPAFSKCLGQAIYVVIVLALLDCINVQYLHSQNLE